MRRTTVSSDAQREGRFTRPCISPAISGHARLLMHAAVAAWALLLALPVAAKPTDGDPLPLDVPMQVRPEGHAEPEIEQAPEAVEEDRGNRVTFLGVAMEDVPDFIRRDFKLKHGEGVLITQVLNDTAAEAAGLEARDVIYKVDGQLLETRQDRGHFQSARFQLMDLIQKKRLGEKIDLEVIRAGRRHKFTARLGERVMPERELMRQRMWMQRGVPPFPQRIPNLPQLDDELDGVQQQPQVQRLLERQRRLMELMRRGDQDPAEVFEQLRKLHDPPFNQPGGENADPIDNLLRLMRERREQQMRALRDLQQQVGPNGGAGVNIMRMTDDGTHRLTFTQRGNRKHLLVKDQFGKVLFDGPVNDEQERAKLDPVLRKKLEAMDR